MLVVSSQFSSFGCPLEGYYQESNYNYCLPQKSESLDSINDQLSPSSHTHDNKNGEFLNANHMVKKLNHNASERDRRKRINDVYSTLRELLPQDDHSRKLSIPATVSRVLKYIPELQRELERLIKKKETLMSKKYVQPDSSIDFKKLVTRKLRMIQSFSAVSATQTSDREIVVQISKAEVENGSIYEVLRHLENEGFLILSASCFQSSQGRGFYNIHIQGQGNQVMDAAVLKERIALVIL